jgi:hypothetical protein
VVNFLIEAVLEGEVSESAWEGVYSLVEHVADC